MIVILENIMWNMLRRKKCKLLPSPESREPFGDKFSETGMFTSLLQDR